MIEERDDGGDEMGEGESEQVDRSGGQVAAEEEAERDRDIAYLGAREEPDKALFKAFQAAVPKGSDAHTVMTAALALAGWSAAQTDYPPLDLAVRLVEVCGEAKRIQAKRRG